MRRKVVCACVCVLISSFHCIMVCIPGGRVGGSGLIQWGTAKNIFVGFIVIEILWMVLI